MTDTQANLPPSRAAERWYHDVYRILVALFMFYIATENGAPEWAIPTVIGTVLVWKVYR